MCARRFSISSDKAAASSTFSDRFATAFMRRSTAGLLSASLSVKAADRSGARYALVLGDKELAAGTVVLKELATGEQREVPLTEVLAQVEAGIAK